MIIRRLLVCVSLLTISISASAAKLVPDLRQLDAVPMHALPALAMQKAVVSAVTKNQAMQFAVGAPLSLTLSDGSWQQLDDGSWSWRTRVYSAGAQTLNFEFAKFHMPANGQLWIYDADGQRVDGPYTHTNENADGKLWTAVTLGDTAIIEVRVPAAEKDQLQLQLSRVHHGYRGFENASKALSGFGKSGSCESNIACPVGASWTNQSRAVARITIGGEYLCTGQLVNNVRQDNTPYFLTAYHCTIGQTSATPASSVVFYWNYQFSQCSNSSTEPTSYQTQTGSSLIAGNQTADFTLVKLNSAPDSSVNAYLQGWNASTSDVPNAGAVIHHPEGDVKKISTFDASVAAPKRTAATLCVASTDGNCTSSRSINAWQVYYSQGVTEEGSSGSGLLNQDQLLIGQLSGGQSACNGNTGNGLYDIYGRLDYGWTASSSSNSQLKANLDPDGTGTLSLAGKDFNTAAVTNGGTTGATSTPTTTSTNISSSSSNGGGGALPPLTLAGLAALLALRRRLAARRAPPV